MCGKVSSLRSDVKQPAHAKVNLFLKVTGRLDNGYHTLVSLMCPIGLHDTLYFDFTSATLEVTCSDPGVPSGRENLVWDAARLFFETTGIDSGIQVHIAKRIPSGAGLGGGSSDAATALAVLNRRFGTPLDRCGLMRLGARIGADVPFFLYRRPALAEGIGDRLSPYDGLTPLYPSAGLSGTFPVHRRRCTKI
jgi:4-diphosphocytidyl-2-C-methyl-D-erythritol kinase